MRKNKICAVFAAVSVPHFGKVGADLAETRIEGGKGGFLK